MSRAKEEIIPRHYPVEVLKKDWGKRKCIYRQGNREFLERVHDLEVRGDDVWLVTLPKCGTTWMQELLWLVMNDFDFDRAKTEHLEVRTPFLEFDNLVYGDLNRAFKPVDELVSPRLIKSHLPLPLLPRQLWMKKIKVVYVFRNPKDALVSEFYHARNLGFGLDVSVDEYIRKSIVNDVDKQQPFEHVTEFFELRHQPWVFYTSFERMKCDLRRTIEGICAFLDKRITEDQMQRMLHHLSFEQMKANAKTNHHWEFSQVRQMRQIPFEKHNFIRKGKVDGYKEELQLETIELLDKWIESELTKRGLTMNELLVVPLIR